jgi:hypothetical protein
VTRLYDAAAAEQYFGRGHKYVAVDLVLTNTGTKAYTDSPGERRSWDSADHGYTDDLSESSAPLLNSAGNYRVVFIPERV